MPEPSFIKINNSDDEEVETFPHSESHFESPEILRDIVIGLSDGLTVPFALCAGLSNFEDSNVVLMAGLAELVGGAISMGLGGYLAGQSEIEHYDNERCREEREVEVSPEIEEEEIYDILLPYGLDRESIEPLVEKLKGNKSRFVDFMMKFELNLQRPDPRREWISATTIGVSYFVGGLIPLSPFFAFAKTRNALYVSIGITALALFAFGLVRGRMMGSKRPFRGAFKLVFLGLTAAGLAFSVTKLLQQ